MNIKALYTLFKRNRINKKIVREASDEYIGSKNGLRTVAWKNGITHQALWYWVRKFRTFRESLHRIVAERGGIPEVIVVDETELKTTQGTVYLWFALDPHNKTLLGFSITKLKVVVLLSACLLSVTGSSAGSLNLVSLSLMPVSGILSYIVSVLNALSSVVVCALILNAVV